MFLHHINNLQHVRNVTCRRNKTEKIHILLQNCHNLIHNRFVICNFMFHNRLRLTNLIILAIHTPQIAMREKHVTHAIFTSINRFLALMQTNVCYVQPSIETAKSQFTLFTIYGTTMRTKRTICK